MAAMSPGRAKQRSSAVVLQAQRRLITRPFLAVTTAVAAFFVYVGVLVPIVPTYVEDELRGGELGVGLAIASFAGAAIAVRPLIGRLVERYGRRAVMVGGAALAASVGSLYGFVDALPLLLVLRALTGVGEAALLVAAATLVSDLAPSHRQAEASSYFSVAVYGGLGLGPIIGDLVHDQTGYRAAFVLAAGCAGVAALLSMFVPSRVVRDPAWLQPYGESVAGPQPSNTSIDLDGTGRSRFVHAAALGPGLVLAIGMAAYSTFAAFLPDHARSLGLSGSGELFAAYSAVCLALRLAGARVRERLGPRTSVTVAFGALGTGLGLLAAVPQVWALWASAVCVGVGMAFMYPSLMALTIGRAPEEERPRAISSFTMFFEVGTAVGGLLLGALADAFGKRPGFGMAVLLCVAGAWALRTVVLPERRREPLVVATPAFSPACGD